MLFELLAMRLNPRALESTRLTRLVDGIEAATAPPYRRQRQSRGGALIHRVGQHRRDVVLLVGRHRADHPEDKGG